jgi:hypothetical protein
MNTNRNNLEIVAKGRLFPTFKELSLIGGTFLLTVFAWIFFRAENITHAIFYIKDLIGGLTTKIGYIQSINLLHWKIGYALPILIVLFMFIEWLGREGQHALSQINFKWNKAFRYVFYYLIVFAIFWFSGKEQQFIYFQF